MAIAARHETESAATAEFAARTIEAQDRAARAKNERGTRKRLIGARGDGSMCESGDVVEREREGGFK